MKLPINNLWYQRLKSVVDSYVDDHITTAGGVIRRAAQVAIERGFTPLPVTESSDDEVNTRLMASDAWFSKYKQQHPGVPDGELLLQLCNALIAETQDTPGTTTNNSSLLPLPGTEKRDQQITLAEFLTHHTSRKSFRLCEASTGIGKGMALIAAAIQTKRNNPHKQVIVAAPTLATLDQLYADYHRFNDEYDLGFNVAKSQSSAEFISKRLAEFWCDEYPDHPQRDAFSQKLASTTTFSLAAFDAFDEVPLHELTVFHDATTNDPGYDEYQEAKSDIKAADILFCTHSMIALSALQGKRNTSGSMLSWEEYEILRDKNYQTMHVSYPYYYFDNRKRIDTEPQQASGFFSHAPIYLIDEAHLFADMVSLMISDSVSLNNLERAMRNYRKQSASRVLEVLQQLLQSIPSSIENDVPLRNTATSKAIQSLESALNDALQAFVKSYSPSQLERSLNGRAVMRYAHSLKRFANDRYSVRLKVSPVKKYIRIESGMGAQEAVSDFIAYSSGGMSFTSATLHVPMTNSALQGYSHIAEQLSVPFDQAITHPPLISSWLATNVSLTLADDSDTFSPSNNEFISNCGNEIEKLMGSVTGGIMVLCTSYEQIEMLEQQLDSPRIIAQKKGQSVRMLANKHMEQYHSGNRPVWLATGAAWTGIDLTDSQADAVHDQAIQHLVVLKLPFEHKTDSRKSDYYQVVARCLFRLKQGIGRLVRRPGRQDMGITVLDGRLNESKGGFPTLKRYLTTTYRH